MAIVTISREFGSEGNSIGTAVAEALGYHFVFKKEIHDIFKQYGIPSFEDLYEADVDFWSRFDDKRTETMDLLTKVIRAFAHQDNVVIVGRCSYAILAGLNDVVHVRVQAPLPIRVERITQENITTPNKVEALVLHEDRNRDRLLHQFYEADWGRASGFDLVINTGKFSPELAVRWIVEAVKGLNAERAAEEPNSKTLEVDSVMDSLIVEMLRTPPEKF